MSDQQCPTCGSTDPAICRAPGYTVRHGHPIELRDKSVAEGGLPLGEGRNCCRDAFHDQKAEAA